jgi:hypothetical protein
MSSTGQHWKNTHGRTQGNDSRRYWRQAFELFLEVLLLVLRHGVPSLLTR